MMNKASEAITKDMQRLFKLREMGPKTKLQLFQLGLDNRVISNLEKYGILCKDKNTFDIDVYYVSDETLKELVPWE